MHRHHAFVDSVGGILPGYGGHRPGAILTSGESAFGGVPLTLVRHRPVGTRF